MQDNTPDIPEQGCDPPEPAVQPPRARTIFDDGSDRTKVIGHAAPPFSAHGHLLVTFPIGVVADASGTLVGRRHVLTAAHNVHDPSVGGTVVKAVFAAGQQGAVKPFGEVLAGKPFVPERWLAAQDPEWDFALLPLGVEVGAPDRAGSLPVKAFTDAQLQAAVVTLTGYPKDKGSTQMWTQAGKLTAVDSELLKYRLDTVVGQSGSGLWLAGGPGVSAVVGVHSRERPTFNQGVRITAAKRDLIAQWIQSS